MNVVFDLAHGHDEINTPIFGNFEVDGSAVGTDGAASAESHMLLLWNMCTMLEAKG